MAQTNLAASGRLITGDEVLRETFTPTASGGVGGKNVAAAGTPVQLVAAPTPCRQVLMTARPGNTGHIAVGYSNAVLATAGSEKGFLLAAGDSIGLAVDDAQKIWIDASVNGEGVSFLYNTVVAS